MSRVRATRAVGLAASLAVVLALSTPAAASAQNTEFQGSVSATIGWQSASLNLTEGQRFTVLTSDDWTVDYRNFPLVTAAGYRPEVDAQIWQPCKFDSSVAYATLLARVGEGPVIHIGAGGVFTSPSSGDLQFRINDQDRCLGDNQAGVSVVANPGAPVDEKPIRGLVGTCLQSEEIAVKCLGYVSLVWTLAVNRIPAIIPKTLIECMVLGAGSRACFELQEQTGVPPQTA